MYSNPPLHGYTGNYVSLNVYILECTITVAQMSSEVVWMRLGAYQVRLFEGTSKHQQLKKKSVVTALNAVLT
jgi:hypothetical protein